MSIQKKLITLCFVTVFTLGLAACGGGGGAPAPGMMDSDVSLEGKYIPSGAMIAVEDVPDSTIPVEGGATLVLAGLGTVECVSVDGCLGTVENGVMTITGDLKIVSVDPALDSDTAMVLAGLAVDMLPGEPTELQKAQAAATTAVAAAVTANMAADAAEAAANAQESNKDADAESYGVAQNAADRAREAADAAQAAADMAADAETLVAAEAARDAAVAAAGDAADERDNAVMYAGMVMDAVDEAAALMAAMTAADMAADAAEVAADAAEASAMKVAKFAGADSPAGNGGERSRYSGPYGRGRRPVGLRHGAGCHDVRRCRGLSGDRRDRAGHGGNPRSRRRGTAA